LVDATIFHHPGYGFLKAWETAQPDSGCRGGGIMALRTFRTMQLGTTWGVPAAGRRICWAAPLAQVGGYGAPKIKKDDRKPGRGRDTVSQAACFAPRYLRTAKSKGGTASCLNLVGSVLHILFREERRIGFRCLAPHLIVDSGGGTLTGF